MKSFNFLTNTLTKMRSIHNSYTFIKTLYIFIILFSVLNIAIQDDSFVRTLFIFPIIVFGSLLTNSKRIIQWILLIYKKFDKKAWQNYFQISVFGIIGISVIYSAIMLFFKPNQQNILLIMHLITISGFIGLGAYLLYNAKNPYKNEDGLLTHIFDQHTKVDFIKFMNLLNQLFFLKGADKKNNKHRGLLNSLFSDFIKISSSSLRSQKSQIGEETTDNDFIKKMLSALDREVDNESNNIYEKYELILSDFINRFRIEGIQLSPKENPQLKILCFLYFCLLKEEINNLSVPIQLENNTAKNNLKEKLSKLV